jgi:hypothetical protein
LNRQIDGITMHTVQSTQVFGGGGVAWRGTLLKRTPSSITDSPRRDGHSRKVALFCTAHRLGGLGGFLGSNCVAEALVLCHAALASKPADPGLVCNLALAHCLAGQDEEAEKWATDASAADPSDEISATVLAFIRDVASGKKSRPKKLCEVFPYG